MVDLVDLVVVGGAIVSDSHFGSAAFYDDFTSGFDAETSAEPANRTGRYKIGAYASNWAKHGLVWGSDEANHVGANFVHAGINGEDQVYTSTLKPAPSGLNPHSIVGNNLITTSDLVLPGDADWARVKDYAQNADGSTGAFLYDKQVRHTSGKASTFGRFAMSGGRYRTRAKSPWGAVASSADYANIKTLFPAAMWLLQDQPYGCDQNGEFFNLTNLEKMYAAGKINLGTGRPEIDIDEAFGSFKQLIAQTTHLHDRTQIGGGLNLTTLRTDTGSDSAAVFRESGTDVLYRPDGTGIIAFWVNGIYTLIVPMTDEVNNPMVEYVINPVKDWETTGLTGDIQRHANGSPRYMKWAFLSNLARSGKYSQDQARQLYLANGAGFLPAYSDSAIMEVDYFGCYPQLDDNPDEFGITLRGVEFRTDSGVGFSSGGDTGVPTALETSVPVSVISTVTTTPTVINTGGPFNFRLEGDTLVWDRESATTFDVKTGSVAAQTYLTSFNSAPFRYALTADGDYFITGIVAGNGINSDVITYSATVPTATPIIDVTKFNPVYDGTYITWDTDLGLSFDVELGSYVTSVTSATVSSVPLRYQPVVDGDYFINGAIGGQVYSSYIFSIVVGVSQVSTASYNLSFVGPKLMWNNDFRTTFSVWKKTVTGSGALETYIGTVSSAPYELDISAHGDADYYVTTSLDTEGLPTQSADLTVVFAATVPIVPVAPVVDTLSLAAPYVSSAVAHEAGTNAPWIAEYADKVVPHILLLNAVLGIDKAETLIIEDVKSLRTTTSDTASFHDEVDTLPNFYNGLEISADSARRVSSAGELDASFSKYLTQVGPSTVVATAVATAEIDLTNFQAAASGLLSSYDGNLSLIDAPANTAWSYSDIPVAVTSKFSFFPDPSLSADKLASNSGFVIAAIPAPEDTSVITLNLSNSQTVAYPYDSLRENGYLQIESVLLASRDTNIHQLSFAGSVLQDADDQHRFKLRLVKRATGIGTPVNVTLHMLSNGFANGGIYGGESQKRYSWEFTNLDRNRTYVFDLGSMTATNITRSITLGEFSVNA